MGVVFVNNLDVEVVVIIRFIVIINDILIIKKFMYFILIKERFIRLLLLFKVFFILIE